MSRKLKFLAAAICALGVATPALAWEPTKTVEFVVPAGTGGGADQMARFIAKLSNEKGLMSQKIVVVNKGLSAGAEGFLSVKMARGDAHKLVISLSNLFTAPYATGVPFNWRDLTPVKMLALDQFVLWVSAETPYTTAKDYLDAVKAANGTMRMGGTGAKQEDQIITAAIEKKAGVKFNYVPMGGGGSVAKAVAARAIDSSVNNPIEALADWRAGKVRPLCVFDDTKMPYTKKVAGDASWGDVPTCKSAGLDVGYQMMRGIFMPAGVSRDQVAFYVELLDKVAQTPEWKAFMEEGAFKASAMGGTEYVNWVAVEDDRHRDLMRTAGFLAK